MQKQAFELLEKINKKLKGDHEPDTMFLHLAEEVGEVARELSKKQKNWREYFNKDKLAEELIDVINTSLIIAKDNDINIAEAFSKKQKKVKERFEIK